MEIFKIALINFFAIIIGLTVEELSIKKFVKEENKTRIHKAMALLTCILIVCVNLLIIFNGVNLTLLIYSLFTLILIMIMYVDFKTFEIPVIFNISICILGVINGIIDHKNVITYIIGFFAISVPIYLLIIATDGRAMGGGDCKLMAVSGLLLGWKNIILAFFLACILGSVIHSIRIKVSNEDHRLAFGPYLAMGVYISMLWGTDMINWYISLI